ATLNCCVTPASRPAFPPRLLLGSECGGDPQQKVAGSAPAGESKSLLQKRHAARHRGKNSTLARVEGWPGLPHIHFLFFMKMKMATPRSTSKAQTAQKDQGWSA